MGKLLAFLLLLALTAGGCTSRSKAKARAQAAYAAGQQQAISRLSDAQRTSIRIMGNVRNPEIPWTDGLTLAQAIVGAEFVGQHNPRQIVIVRQRERFPVDPKALLRGEDIPLEPGDTVEIHP
jgi:hypothetical protein